MDVRCPRAAGPGAEGAVMRLPRGTVLRQIIITLAGIFALCGVALMLAFSVIPWQAASLHALRSR